MDKNILKIFMKYVTLNIAGQAAYSVYTMADTFFVSKALGADGLTALNLAFPVFCFISGTGLMIGIGGGTRFSILKGRGDHSGANIVFTKGVIIAAAFAVLYITAGILFSEEIAELLGADSSVFEATHTYLHVLLLFAPAFLMNHLLQCFVRNDGNPSLAAAAMAIGCAGNIVLDYIFIFPMGMGIFGAILATGLGPVISMAVMSSYFIKKENSFRFAPELLRGNKGENREGRKIIASGIPPFLSEATSGIVMFLFNFIILGIAGNIGVAAFSVITVVSLVVVAVYTGLSQGMQPLLARCYGEGKRKELKYLLKCGFIALAVISAAIYSIIYFNCDSITAVFNDEGNRMLREYAVSGMKLYFIACPFIGFNIIMATYNISVEKTGYAQIITLSRGFFVLVPVAFIMAYLFEMTGVWCAYPAAEAVTAVIGVGLYLRGRRSIM